MVEICCHMNQCDASVQYFAILHAVRETYDTENTFTFSFILKNKRHSTMQQSLWQKRNDRRAIESSYCAATILVIDKTVG